jgi:hypothetical protein
MSKPTASPLRVATPLAQFGQPFAEHDEIRMMDRNLDPYKKIQSPFPPGNPYSKA